MNARQSLLGLAARYHLNSQQTQQLLQAAGLRDEPAALTVCLPRGVAVLAAALGGLGLIMWMAANWDAMGRPGHFALLQGLVLATGVGATLIPRGAGTAGLVGPGDWHAVCLLWPKLPNRCRPLAAVCLVELANAAVIAPPRSRLPAPDHRDG